MDNSGKYLNKHFLGKYLIKLFHRMHHLIVSALQQSRIYQVSVRRLIYHQEMIVRVQRHTVASNEFWLSRSFFDVIENTPL
jgi:hypothetical protein